MYTAQNEPFGATPGGFSTPDLTYTSFGAAWNSWGNRWGSAVQNVGENTGTFLNNLHNAGYNTENYATGGDPNWAPGIQSVVPSLESRFNQWMSQSPTCDLGTGQ